MKCKVCGCEVGPTQTHCPMCGARVSADDEVIRATRELSWNTKDFPKPKEMSDINMSWPEFNSRTNTVSLSEAEISAALEKNRPVTVMSEDASEGYVSIPDKKEEKPAAKAEPAKEAPKAADEQTRPYWYTQKFTATGVMQTGPAWPMAPGDTKPSYPATAKIETMTLSEPMPISPVQPDPASMEFTLRDIIPERDAKPQDTQPRFYTFQRKNDEFQKLLDREYDRIHAMHGEDYDPLHDTLHPFPSEPTVHAQELSDFEKLLMEDVPVQTEETPAQKFFSQAPEIPKVEETVDPEPPEVEVPTGDPTKFDIEAIENTIKELESQEVIAENNRSLRKKRLAAMAAAREAYFKSLDDVAGGKDPDVAAKEMAAAVEAAKKEPVTVVPDATFINLDAAEPSEPTREIPVGGILEALAGIGTVRSAAMAVKEAPMITADPANTRVFKRISEDAEERARLYEQLAEPAAEEPAEDLLAEKSLEELIAELKMDAERAAESIPEDKTAAQEEQPLEELPAEEPVIEEVPAEEPAYEEPAEEPVIEEAPTEEPAVGEAPAEGPVIEEAPAEEPAPAEPAAEEASAEESPAEGSVPDVAEIIPEEPERAHVAGAADAELLATKYDLEEELGGLEEEKPLEVTQQFDPALAEKDDADKDEELSEEKDTDEDETEDDDEDDDEEEAVSRHIFLKIVIAILIVCAVFELAVFGFSKLAPDAGATQTLVQIEEAIRAAFASAFEAIKGLFGGR